MCGGPVGDVLDTTSSVLGTDGGGGGILGAVEDVGQSVGSGLAAIDPSPAIGSGLADVDKFVGDEIPGGWVTVASVAAPYAAPYVTGAALTAGQAAALSAGISGAGSAVRGDSIEDALKNAALAGATSYGLNSLTSAGGESIALPSETPYIDLPDGELLLGGGGMPDYSAIALPSETPYVDLPDQGTLLTPNVNTPAPVFDYSQEVILSPGGNYIPANTLPSEIAGLDESIRLAGEAAIKAAPVKISPLQAVNALRGATGLLGGGQQATPGAATSQFRGSTVPQGAVDYSGIINLLQTRAPQRNPYSLLG